MANIEEQTQQFLQRLKDNNDQQPHTCNLQNPYNTRICSKAVLPRNKQKR